jgi:ribonuclease P protein component
VTSGGRTAAGESPSRGAGPEADPERAGPGAAATRTASLPGVLRPAGRFPATQRVRKRSEFLEIQAHGRRVSTPRFVLLVHARDGASATPRWGITVSRKVGGAVVRNRAKRVLREAFRATRDLWPPDCDVVVVVRHLRGGIGLDDAVAELRAADRALRRRAAEARRDREARAARLAPER